jgi:hypothetical protein
MIWSLACTIVFLQGLHTSAKNQARTSSKSVFSLPHLLGIGGSVGFEPTGRLHGPVLPFVSSCGWVRTYFLYFVDRMPRVQVERAVRSSLRRTPPMSCYTLFRGWLLLSLPFGFFASSLLHARRRGRRYLSSRTEYVCSVDWARRLRTTNPRGNSSRRRFDPESSPIFPEFLDFHDCQNSDSRRA